MADTSPIDIPCEKLAEWLTERRHLDKDFNLRLRALRKKVDAAIADLPVRQDLQAITRNKENVSYWDCQAVLEILLKVAKAAGTDGKSFFGNYKDEQLHLWDALARAYVKGNLHVAHAARIMNQNVTSRSRRSSRPSSGTTRRRRTSRGRSPTASATRRTFSGSWGRTARV